jgi:hypothetical protein
VKIGVYVVVTQFISVQMGISACLLSPKRSSLGSQHVSSRTASDLPKDSQPNTTAQDGTNQQKRMKLGILLGVSAAVFGATLYIVRVC